MSIEKLPKSSSRKAAPKVFVGQSQGGSRRAEREPDLVTAIFDLLCEKHPGVAEERGKLETAVRQHFKGLRGTVTDRPASSTTAERVLALFNGRNTREVARRLGLSRSQVYRYIKQPGRKTTA